MTTYWISFSDTRDPIHRSNREPRRRWLWPWQWFRRNPKPYRTVNMSPARRRPLWPLILGLLLLLLLLAGAAGFFLLDRNDASGETDDKPPPIITASAEPAPPTKRQDDDEDAKESSPAPDRSHAVPDAAPKEARGDTGLKWPDLNLNPCGNAEPAN